MLTGSSRLFVDFINYWVTFSDTFWSEETEFRTPVDSKRTNKIKHRESVHSAESWLSGVLWALKSKKPPRIKPTVNGIHLEKPYTNTKSWYAQSVGETLLTTSDSNNNSDNSKLQGLRGMVDTEHPQGPPGLGTNSQCLGFTSCPPPAMVSVLIQLWFLNLFYWSSHFLCNPRNKDWMLSDKIHCNGTEHSVNSKQSTTPPITLSFFDSHWESRGNVRKHVQGLPDVLTTILTAFTGQTGLLCSWSY